MSPDLALRLVRARHAAKEQSRKRLADLEVGLTAAFNTWFEFRERRHLDMLEYYASAIEVMGHPKPYKLFLEMNRKTAA